MLNRLILIAVLFFMSISAFTQRTIKGTVFNEEDEPLINATVVLLSPADSIMKYFGVTNKEGFYQILNIRDGNYIMQFSFVGSELLIENIAIPSEKGEDFGKTVLKTLSIDAVEVIGEYVPIRFRSDTVEFNAKAFKTKPDAVVEDLLKKIPGIEVDVSGNIKALGEDVTKVLVDGKEFFGRDKKIATKNLPADAIDKVEVYDKKSYEAEFTGIDDGVRDRTINLELLEEAKAGNLGNLEVGAGTNELYKASGKLYRFKESTQLALLGMYNNINQFGFTAQNMGKFGDQVKGLNSTGAGGFNFSYNPTPFNKYYISYLGSVRTNQLDQHTEGEYFSDQGSYYQSSDKDEETRNTPNSFDFGIHHRFNPRHNLIFTGGFDLIKNDLDRITNTITFTEADTVNDLFSTYDQLSDILSGSAKASYMAKLNEGKTQFNTTFNISQNNHFSGANFNNSTHIYNPDTIIVADQFLDNQTDRFSVSVNSSFLQKIAKLWFISPGVKIGMNNETIDQKQGNTISDNLPVDSVSPEFLREHKFLETGFTFRRTTSASNFYITLTAAWNELGSTLWDDHNDNGTWFHILPSLFFEKRIRAGRRVKFRYSANVNLPSAGQLLPIYNTTNPLLLVQGNQDLKPELRHILFSELSIFDQFSFTFLHIRLFGSYTQDKISWSQTISQDLVKFNTPVNVPWDYSANGYANFSTPIRKLGIKVNLRINEGYHKGLNIVNDEDNILNSWTHTVDFSIENRLKEKLDARIGSSISLTDIKYSIQDELDNRYYNTVYYGDLYYSPNDHWNFQFTTRITNYNSESLDESINMPLIDAGISYYFLKGNRGVLTLRGIDLLDKNTGFQQISDVNYLMQINSNTLGRYIMLSFKYRLTSMGGKKPMGKRK